MTLYMSQSQTTPLTFVLKQDRILNKEHLALTSETEHAIYELMLDTNAGKFFSEVN